MLLPSWSVYKTSGYLLNGFFVGLHGKESSCLILSKTKIDISWLMKATRKIFQGLWNHVPFTVKSIVSARCYQRMEDLFKLLKLG